MMKIVSSFLIFSQKLIDKLVACQFLASVALRAYLVPVFWIAGMNKVNHFPDIVSWFGNSEWGLGLPFPTMMAFLATAAEVGGAVLLALGLGTRWVSIPLMITMLVAAFSVHWENGWQAVHDPMSPWASENVGLALERLERAKSVLQEHTHYEWLTEHGGFVVSNNGVEWAATYFVMLLALFYLGGGKYVSADYWIKKNLFVKE